MASLAKSVSSDSSSSLPMTLAVCETRAIVLSRRRVVTALVLRNMDVDGVVRDVKMMMSCHKQ